MLANIPAGRLLFVRRVASAMYHWRHFIGRPRRRSPSSRHHSITQEGACKAPSVRHRARLFILQSIVL
jgi:hypothetical protein